MSTGHRAYRPDSVLFTRSAPDSSRGCMGGFARGVLLGAFLGLAPSHVAAQPASPPSVVMVRGRVTDSQSQSPIGQAEVVLVEIARRAYTDDDRQFVLEGVAPRTYTLSVTRLGYAP